TPNDLKSIVEPIWLSSASIVSGTRFATRPPKNAPATRPARFENPTPSTSALLAPNVLSLMPPMNPADIDRFFCLASAGHAAASTRNSATAEFVSVRFRTPLLRTLGNGRALCTKRLHGIRRIRSQNHLQGLAGGA